MKKIKGKPIWAVACDSSENGCSRCMFSNDGNCSVSDDMDKGLLPDCSDTPGSSNTLGYRVYFIPATNVSKPFLLDSGVKTHVD